MPIFWLAMILIVIFGVNLELLPFPGRLGPTTAITSITGLVLVDSLLTLNFAGFWDGLLHLIMPAIALGTIPMAVIMRMTRSSMLEVMGEDYVRTARAKGVVPWRVVVKHSLRNALLPTVTVIGLAGRALDGGFDHHGDHLLLARGRPDHLRVHQPPRLRHDTGRGPLRRRPLRPHKPPRRRTLRGPRPQGEVIKWQRRSAQQDVAAEPADVKTRSRWQDFRRTFFSNRLALIGLIIISIFILVAIFAPLVAPYDPLAQDLEDKFAGPSLQHPFGQDELGRDILSRVIFGARISLTAGLAAVIISTVVGTIVALFAGYFGGYTDSILMRLMDILLAFPSILLAIVIVSVLGPSLVNAMLAVGIVFIPQMARVVRSAVISVKERDYIEAERALGAGNTQIIFSGVLPNSTAPLVVQATLTMATAILDIAALSFLGLGARAPTPEWGAMLTDAFKSGFGVFVTGQHALIFPGVAIALAVLSVNFVGDGLRDALDPRRRG